MNEHTKVDNPAIRANPATWEIGLRGEAGVPSPVAISQPATTT